MNADFYYQRFGFCERQIASPPPEDLGLVVVIPCFNEPDLIGSLESLWDCERPACAVEVMVVINAASRCCAEVQLQNQRTLQQAADWAAGRVDQRLRLHLLHFPDLPAKQAGVGLARKIGMDEAARRFDDIGKPEGVIVCYDADCRCERNYLRSLERHFREHPRTPGCSIYFEHPLEGPLAAKVYEAIARYELHLRYYVQALRYAGFPYARHTVGSCMAVRAGVYKKQGGMNKRQAGEDFYFLNKIIPLGGFTDLITTTVFPSPRVSDRVPFGTGKAVQAYVKQEMIETYPLRAFLDLKRLFDRAPALGGDQNLAGAGPLFDWPESVRTFLEANLFRDALQEIRENTASEAACRKRFFHWFDAFRVLKFIHHARDRFYGAGDVKAETTRLLKLLPSAGGLGGEFSVCELLKIYRQLEFQSGWPYATVTSGSR